MLEENQQGQNLSFHWKSVFLVLIRRTEDTNKMKKNDLGARRKIKNNYANKIILPFKFINNVIAQYE